MTLLSVNVNKIAVLRNSRGGDQPDVCAAAQACIAAGAHGITVHPRPDQRHIRPGDVTAIKAILGDRVEFNIEGDPRSPHNEGTLCPKGAAIFQLHVNPNRPTQVLHRAAGASDWEVWDLERAMNRIAELTKKTRDETFIEQLPNGKLVNMTPAIFALGGATLEVEFNHLCQKLLRGLGIVAIENQARI